MDRKDIEQVRRLLGVAVTYIEGGAPLTAKARIRKALDLLPPALEHESCTKCGDEDLADLKADLEQALS